MEKVIQFHLEEFDGPLDLMLALVSKNKMSIYDIEILTIIDQYLEIVGGVSPEAMESASEFITMAAHLVQIKSAMLLPRSDEGERMREELTGLLVEYSACKAVAAQLKEMAADVYIAVRRPQPFEPDYEYTGRHEGAELLAAMQVMAGRTLARRPPQRERFEEIVATPVVSVGSRVIGLLLGLMRKKIAGLREIIHTSHSRSETVATFLALLELVRGGRVKIDDEGGLHLAQRGGARSKAHAPRQAAGEQRHGLTGPPQEAET